MLKPVDIVMQELDKIPDCLNRVELDPHIPPRFKIVSSRQIIENPLFPEVTEKNDPERPSFGVSERKELEELFQELDAEFAERGFEALAWYSPYHFTFNWGIFIPELSLHYAADRWFHKQTSYEKRLTMAFQAFMGHELVHFASEYMISQHEIYADDAGYVFALAELEYQRMPYFHREEALANANKLIHLRELYPSARFTKLQRAMEKAPPGYRDYEDAMDANGFSEHISHILADRVGFMENKNARLFNPGLNQTAFWPGTKSVSVDCPVTLIEGGHGRYVLPPYALGHIE